MASTELVPSLLIIGERTYCSSFEDWYSRILRLQELLPLYPWLGLQIRNKTPAATTELLQLLPQLQPTSQLWINGTIEDPRLFLRHLPEYQITQARKYPRFATSIHSQAALYRAMDFQPQFLQYGAIFRTKKPVQPLGLDRLSQISALSSRPILAVGGINSMEKIIECKKAGAYGVSIGSWIMQAADMKQRIERIG